MILVHDVKQYCTYQYSIKLLLNLLLEKFITHRIVCLKLDLLLMLAGEGSLLLFPHFLFDHFPVAGDEQKS